MNSVLQKFCSKLASLGIDLFGSKPIAQDGWITVHPNGRRRGTGQPVLLDDEGVVQGGMGGKFNGKHISEAKGEGKKKEIHGKPYANQKKINASAKPSQTEQKPATPSATQTSFAPHTKSKEFKNKVNTFKNVFKTTMAGEDLKNAAQYAAQHYFAKKKLEEMGWQPGGATVINGVPVAATLWSKNAQKGAVQIHSSGKELGNVQIDLNVSPDEMAKKIDQTAKTLVANEKGAQAPTSTPEPKPIVTPAQTDKPKTFETKSTASPSITEKEATKKTVNSFVPFSDPDGYVSNYGKNAPRYEKTEKIPQKPKEWDQKDTAKSVDLVSSLPEASKQSIAKSIDDDFKSALDKKIVIPFKHLKEQAILKAAAEGLTGDALIKAAKNTVKNHSLKQQAFKFDGPHIGDKFHDFTGKESLLAMERKLDSAAYDKVGKEEGLALRFYSSPDHPASYKEINDPLRTGSKMTAEAAASVRELDKLFSKTSTKNSMILYRGIHGPEAAKIIKKIKDGSLGINGETKYKAYMSTSVDPEVSRDFTGNQKVGEKGVFFNLTLPKGGRAIALGGHSLIKSEKEVLLPRNTRLKITGIKENTTEDGPNYYIDAEVVS